MSNKLFLRIAGLVLAVSLLSGAAVSCAASWGGDADPAPGSGPADEGPQDESSSGETGDLPGEDGNLPGETGGLPGEDAGETEEAGYQPPVLVGADGRHTGYINGYADGGFHPSDEVTRAQAAVMLYRLIESPGEERAAFSDVTEEDWYGDAVGYLGALGVLGVPGEAVEPDGAVTRGEFVAMIDYLMLGHDLEDAYIPFPDVPQDHKYAREIACAASRGWVLGNDGGEFEPDAPVTRAEAVTIINRALGAVPDREYMKNLYFSPFSDFFATHWAYYDVMEASVGHTHSETGSGGWIEADLSGLERAEGIYFNGDDYCYVNAEGNIVRDAYVGSRYFGADGFFTSGDAALDGYVKEALASVVKPGMSDMEKLRAAYLYTRDSFTYLRRNYYDVGDVSWANKEAVTMFTTKRGNCYCYASVFYSLARQLGFDAVLVSGKVNNSNPIPHAWVEIEENGEMYMYDAELEMAHRRDGDPYDLWHMAYDGTPWRYWR